MSRKATRSPVLRAALGIFIASTVTLSACGGAAGDEATIGVPETEGQGPVAETDVLHEDLVEGPVVDALYVGPVNENSSRTWSPAGGRRSASRRASPRS